MELDSGFILALTTSSGIARVAAVAAQQSACSGNDPAQQFVFQNEGFCTLFDFEIVEYKDQSAQLLPCLQRALSDSNLKGSDCLALAVDIGPGGFTSLRTSCGIAQGLATAWNVPTVPLSSFECMAASLEYGQPGSATTPVTFLMDARLGQIYCASLRLSLEQTEWLQTPILIAANALSVLEKIQQTGNAVCDASVYNMLESWPATTLTEKHNTKPSQITQSAPSAIALAALAYKMAKQGRVSTPFDCQPLYVREKVAQTTSERMAAKNGTL